MPIIGTLPNNIQNGQAVDATPVMADFNFIINQVNANGNPIGTLTAPSGTSMMFQQNFAPTGWVAQTGAQYSDAFIRCNVPATFSGPQGSVGASMLILGPITSDGHSLTVGELAAHNHNLTDPGHTHTDSGHAHVQNDATYYNFAGIAIGAGGGAVTNTSPGVATHIGNAAIVANTTGISVQNAGSGTAHSHTLTANCKFVDQIVAVKS
jgi:hypothetical protein